jgi:hypothetical protein
MLLVDLSNCPVNQVEEVVRRVPDYITVQPLGSVMVLTDFTGATFDRDAIRAIKETAVFDKPFVRKSALVGIEGMPASFYEELKSFSQRDMTIFKTRDAALIGLTVRGMHEPTPTPVEEPETSEKAKETVIGDASNTGLPGRTHLDRGA